VEGSRPSSKLAARHSYPTPRLYLIVNTTSTESPEKVHEGEVVVRTAFSAIHTTINLVTVGKLPPKRSTNFCQHNTPHHITKAAVPKISPPHQVRLESSKPHPFFNGPTEQQAGNVATSTSHVNNKDTHNHHSEIPQRTTHCVNNRTFSSNEGIAPVPAISKRSPKRPNSKGYQRGTERVRKRRGNDRKGGGG